MWMILGAPHCLAGALYFVFKARDSASLQPPRTSLCLAPSLRAFKVELEPCPICRPKAESNAMKALQCVRKPWFWRGIGITSSFPPTFFVCYVVRCSELAGLGFSVVLIRQRYIIFDGKLSKTLPVCSGETTGPMGQQ